MVYSPNLEKHKVLFHEKKNCEDATCYYTLFTVYLCSGENVICDLNNVSNRQSRTIKGTHILKRKTFKCVLVLAQKHHYDALLCCKAVHWDETVSTPNRKKKTRKVSETVRSVQCLPKDSAYILITQSQSPSTEAQHSIFLFYTKNSFLLHLFLCFLIIFCLHQESTGIIYSIYCTYIKFQCKSLYFSIYIYTYIHTYIHIYIYTYIHTYIYIYIHTYTYTYTYTLTKIINATLLFLPPVFMSWTQRSKTFSMYTKGLFLSNIVHKSV